jgi:hypothetical protein
LISADTTDLGPPLDMETLDWSSEQGVRRLGQEGGPPTATATLGQPLGWWGPDRPGGKQTDRWMLVRFALSVRADPGSKVEWSRLTVDLPQEAGDQLIVTDQYPDDVLDEELRDVHLSLSPQLKLLQVTASLGTVSTIIRVAKVVPVISPWGGQEATFGWDLTSTDRHPIGGVRHFYTVIAGCQQPELSVLLGVDVDARTAGGLLRRGQRSRASQQRRVQVWRQTWD